MDEGALKELQAIREMVLMWKNKYFSESDSTGGDEFLASDFMEEIETFVIPYIRRLIETGYLNEIESREFMDACFKEVQDLARLLKETENPWLRIVE